MDRSRLFSGGSFRSLASPHSSLEDARGDGLGDQARHFGRALGGAVEPKCSIGTVWMCKRLTSPLRIKPAAWLSASWRLLPNRR